MTEPLSPDDALVLAYVDGTLDAPARAEFEARLPREPALRAEVEGLQALRTLLDADSAYGQQSGFDVPPAHLVDAIVRAEVAARPAEIRAAMGLLRDAPSVERSDKPWWARLQALWMPGGVAVGAAAAVLFVVTRTGNVDRAPEAPSATAAKPDAALAAPAAPETAETRAKNAPEPAPPPPPPPASELQAAVPADLEAKPQDALASTEQDAANAEAAKAEAAQKTAQKDAKEAPTEPPKEAPKGAPSPKRAEAKLDDGFASDDAGLDRGNAGDFGSGGGAAAQPMATAAPSKPAPTAPTATPAPAAPAAEAPATAVGSYGKATDGARELLERIKAKKQARIESERAAESKTSTPDHLTPTEAREEVARKKRIDDASMVLSTAEHELALGNFARALELAQNAEAQVGAALGLYPAAVEARAFFGLRQAAESARVGSRLLAADPADPSLVDGMIAAAQGASSVGDRRLAERLLQRALLPQNKDAARRALAQRLLAALRAPMNDAANETVAPSKAKY